MIKRILGRAMKPDPHDCEEVRANLSDYLDGELELVQAKRLEQHVGFCPRCRNVLGNLRVALGGLGRLGRLNAEDRAAAERARQTWRTRGD